MRTGKKKSGIESVIFWVLMGLVILAGLGAIAYFAAREQGVTKYVEYNGQKYYGNADTKSVGRMLGDTYTFGVGAIGGGTDNYTVKITPNPANDFTFTVDGQPYAWASKDDYTDLFDVTKESGKFTVTVPDDYVMERVLAVRYGGDIEIESTLKDNDYFLLTVTLEDSVVTMSFRTAHYAIAIDPPEVRF